MAMAIKDVGTLQAKYVQRATNAVDAYKAGVAAPKASQSGNAIAAAGTWQSSVSSSTAMNRYKGGLAKSGDAGWQAGATNKGAAHYPDGVRGGANKWGTNVAPYLQVISSLSLSPKGIRGSDANYQRVKDVGAALHAKKVAASGG